MAARYPQAPVVATTQNPRHVSITELERALEDLTQQVAERKRQLIDTFKHIHEMVAQKEVALLTELDAIPVDIQAKIQERRASLEQLTNNRDDTEKELNANRLNALLQKNLKNIKEEMENILSEQISFPLVSISCQMEEIERKLEEKCRIMKRPNPYRFRALPIWHGVKEGREEDQLFKPSSICIDPTSQLIYVGENSFTGRIQVFTSEGNHHSTLHNPLMDHCKYMKSHKDHIYLTTFSLIPELSITKLSTDYFLKVNKKGETVKKLEIYTPLRGIFIEGSNIYTCVEMSLTVHIFDLNLKPTKKIILKAISFDEDATPRDIILHKQQMFILFCYWGVENNYHPDPIQVFKLDGTLIRSLVTGNDIKYALYFCLDSYENILVSECNGHCISIFSPDGILTQKIGREGMKEEGELYCPRGIAVDYKQRIIIVDWKKDNILQAF